MAVAYDPKSPAVLANPYPVFRQLQIDDPVHWSELLGGWVLTRYADVQSFLRDLRFSSSRIAPRMETLSDAERGRIDSLGRALSLWMVFTDPPDHTRLRMLVHKAFTPQVIARMRGRVEAIVEELLSQVEHRGEMDLIGDFSYPLPATVIADMIGVPSENLEQLKQWSDDIAGFAANALSTAAVRQRAQQSMAAMAAYFWELMEVHRRAPSDNIMSRLIAVEEAGETLSEDEIVGTCIFLLFAGHETTTNLIGNGVLAFLEHPEQWQVLRDNPSCVASAVEECLRYDGPVMSMARVASEEIELGGKRIRQGDRVFGMLNAANRDPRQFPEPDRFDIRRQDNRHVAFGFGIHFCLGAPLARVEGQVALSALARRFKRFELQTSELQWNESIILRGVKALPLSWVGS
ncbi:MAG: hypothetical protein ETSY1_03055 [Candidatus Entotheonella factor]|uniref:Cytochrome P450 n=1 Tax=Entotheonella factor TaxID=1429438 RepID=W4LXE8_ENTF1|nr:MAG: hypothetical protein ETSY1_03055 [Candidatus Entotheonella factor]